MSAQHSSPNRILLKTSELSCFFEPQTGFLRQVLVNDCEVIRAIYGAVRDQNWNTVHPEITVSRTEIAENHFHLEFQVECSSAGIAFGWTGTIEGTAGRLSFKFAGKARSTFRKNRIGLCLLHPIRECAGKPCRIRGTGKSWVGAEFPFFISPHQPFKGLGALSWRPTADLEATVTFAGEVFETEDHRNWTDASFKTYGTPLEKPYPEEIVAGTPVNQSITLQLERRTRTSAISRVSNQGAIFVAASGEKPLPTLGVCASSYGGPLLASERARLAALKLNHVRVDLHFDDKRWRDSLEQATADASAIGAHIQPALFLSDEEHLRAFASAVDPQLLRSCLVFPTQESSASEQWLGLASQLLTQTAVVGGTNANFAELNRQRPAPKFPAAYSINPQVHAFDDLSLMENLEAQPETVHSARQFSALGLYLSPITLRPRENPGTTTAAGESYDRLPSSVDSRQRTLFGAAWTVGSLARLLPLDGVESLTYYEAIGWKGLIESARGNPLPNQFDSTPGEVFPVYHVFHALADAKALFPVTNPVPQKIAAIAFHKKGAMHVLLANLESELSIARLQLPVREVALQVLTEHNLADGSRGQLPHPDTLSVPQGEAVFALPSYSLAFLRCI